MHPRRVQDSPSEEAQAAPWKSDRTPTGWQQQRDWEQDRERLRHLQKRAGETVADLSESTLDSIVAGAESLKAKLAELRAERERLEAEKKVARPVA